VITDAVAGTAARVPGVLPTATTWTKNRREWTSAEGWSVIAILAMRGEVDVGPATRLIARVKAGIHAAPNRTRYSMNSALIAIGGSLPALRDRALAAARSIGVVLVDHGETCCRTPDAAYMIDKMVAHQAAKRTRVTGARVSARKKATPTKRTRRGGPVRGRL